MQLNDFQLGRGAIPRILFSFATSAISVWTGFGLLALVAGGYAYSQLFIPSDRVAAVILAVLLLGPPLVLLHFVTVLRVVRHRFSLAGPPAWLRTLLATRLFKVGIVMQPWYWMLLGCACLGSLTLVPLAVTLAFT
jgi:hypothetical protein